MRTISGKACEFPQKIEKALAEYRHKIFIERLGWPLPVEDGVERDQFDHPDTFYVLAQDDDGSICGCARLLPTDRPYLLGEIFPQLMAGASPPQARDIWELSRFAAAFTGMRPGADQAMLTRTLLAAAVDTAARQGAQRLITVSPLGVERLLLRMGVHAHRAGPPLLVEGKPVFACWIELDRQTFLALGLDMTPSGSEDAKVWTGSHLRLDTDNAMPDAQIVRIQ